MVTTFSILSSEAAPDPDWIDDWIAGTGPWKGGPYDLVVINVRRKRSTVPVPQDLPVPWWVDDWVAGNGLWGGGPYAY